MPSQLITIETEINSSAENVWNCFTLPEHVVHWNFASPDWHCPKADSEFVLGGKFNYTMAAKDGSFSFDLWGIFDNIKPLEIIEYTLGDGRKVTVKFEANNNSVKVSQSFEPEQENSEELQRDGWQAILNNFKMYVEEYSEA